VGHVRLIIFVPEKCVKWHEVFGRESKHLRVEAGNIILFASV